MRKSLPYVALITAAALPVLFGAGCSPNAKKTRHMARADKFYDDGNYASAEVEYINVLRIDHDNAAAYNRLGKMYFDEGRFGAAIQCLNKSVDLQANNLEARVRLATIDLAAGHTKEARTGALAVLEKNPQDPEAPLVLAGTAVTEEELADVRARLQKIPVPASGSAPIQVALGTLEVRQHNYQGAEELYQEAIAIDPKSSAAHGALGQLYWAQNDRKKAAEQLKLAADVSPIRSGRRLQYAQFKLQGGDLAGAQEILTEITKQAPDYLPALSGLAEIELSQKKYDESLAAVEKILAQEPRYFDGLVLRGRIRLAKNEVPKAIADFESVVTTYPQSSMGHFQLALAYMAKNDINKAVASLNQTLALNPGSIDAALMLGTLKLRARDFDGVVVVAMPLAQAKPPVAQAEQMVADAYRAKGDLETSLKWYRQLAVEYPKNSEPLTMIGGILFQQRKLAEAREAFEKARTIAPDSLATLEDLVNLDVIEKKFAEAQQLIDGALGQGKSQAEMYFMKGKIFTAQGDWNSAANALTKSVELKSDLEPAYMLLARVYLDSNQRPKAIADLEKATSQNPTNVAPLMMLGMIQGEGKNYDAARAAYEKILSIDPNYSGALNNLAYLYSEQLGQPDKALPLARHGRELMPQDPLTADTLGWVLYRKGEYLSALPLLQESAAKIGGEPEALYHLGATQYMLGQEENARATFEKALSLRKDFTGKEDIQQRLTVLAIDPKTAGADAQGVLEKQLTAQADDPLASDRLASIYEKEGNLDKALAISQDAIKVNPRNTRALIRSARIYATRPADTAKALEAAKAAYKLAPDNGELVALLGRLVFQSGDYKWSLSLLQEAARQQPNNPAVLSGLAWAAYSQGQIELAGNSMRQAGDTAEGKRFLDMLALAAHPAEAVAAEGQVKQALAAEANYVPALMASAGISEQKADAKSAETAYEKVLAIYPDFVPAKKALAILSAQNGDVEKAYGWAMKSREMYPDDAALTRALGIITYRRGDYTRVADLLKNVASDDAVGTYYLGMAQYQMKRRDQSKATLQKALDLNLSGDLAGEAKKALADLK